MATQQQRCRATTDMVKLSLVLSESKNLPFQ